MITLENGWLVVSEKIPIKEILRMIDEAFEAIPIESRYNPLVVQNAGKDNQDLLCIGRPKPAEFHTDNECSVPAYRTVASILEAARAKEGCDLTKTYMLIPYGRPNELTIHVKQPAPVPTTAAAE